MRRVNNIIEPITSKKRVIIAVKDLKDPKNVYFCVKNNNEDHQDIGLLAGVYRSWNVAALCDESPGRKSITASISLPIVISRLLIFDKRDTRRMSDRLASSKNLWD